MISLGDISSLFPAQTDTGQKSLLDTLYGRGGTAASTGTASLSAMRNAERDETKLVAQEAKKPEVARDIAAFRTAVAKAKTPAELLKNPIARKVLLTANGLSDMIDSPALATKAS